jgi:alkaline phosphatase D
MKFSPKTLAFWLGIQIAATGVVPAQLLTHGPIVGGVTASEAKVFVRTDSAANVTLRYGTDPDLQTYFASASVTTSESSDFTATIPLTGLTAETIQYLNVLVNGVPQFSAPPFPSFATFPATGAVRDFNFVVLSDFATASKLTGEVATFASAAGELPVFAFIGGDFDHSNPQTLADKRQMFKSLYDPQTRFMSGFAPLILSHFPIVHQWDDHDAGLNNLDKNYPDWNLTQQVFQEYTPSYPLPAVTPGIWQNFSYAQADFFVLDCRSQRDFWLDPEGPDKSMLDGNNLGAIGQLQWLEKGLLTSSARWKVIFTSVITNPTTKQNDAWGAYPTEWNALKDFINSNHISGIVFIAGDLHLGAIDNGTQAGFPEMCVAKANETQAGFCASAATGIWSEGYYDDTCAGYGLVTILQNPDRLVLQVKDQDGVAHVSYTVLSDTPTPTPTPTSTPQPPVITKQPVNQRVNVGETATFSVTATGTAPITYQWRKNGTNIIGAISPSYTTPPATPADNGSRMSVVVSNPVGSVTSATGRLRVNLPPSITTQPTAQTVKAGQTAKFTVTAAGTEPLTYQWKKNGIDISGAIELSYTTPPTTPGDNGAIFAVTVTNFVGAITSNNASLTVK